MFIFYAEPNNDETEIAFCNRLEQKQKKETKKIITRKLLAKGGAFSGTRSIVLIRIPPNGIINI